jgi:hypothetical protein
VIIADSALWLQVCGSNHMGRIKSNGGISFQETKEI